MRLLALLIMISFAFSANAQTNANKPAPSPPPKPTTQKPVPDDDSRKLIQFSGVVVEKDSLKPVPYTIIIIKNKKRGTVCDYFGFFSFVAQERDTIEFSAVGYKKGYFIIPDSLSSNKYSLIQVLHNDTIMLPMTTIYPWPSKEQFKKEFLAVKIPEDDYDRAQKNLDQQQMQMQYETMPMDGSMNFKNKMQEQYSKLYYAGQLPPNNLLNPIAWAKFIKAWRNGDFKKKDTKDLPPD
jgi:hypothetical protein